MKKWYARAVEEATTRLTGCCDLVEGECEGLNGRGGEMPRNILRRMTVYAAAGMAVVATTPAYAFAAGDGALDIRSVSSILDFLGNICIVVGVVLAGWNVVQAAQTAKETQGLQIDRSFWGIIGGVGMAVGGGAIKTAGSLWHYGSAS